MQRHLQVESDFNFLWFNSMYKSCSEIMDDDESDNEHISDEFPRIELRTIENWPTKPDKNDCKPDENDCKPDLSTDSQTYHITDLPPEIMQHILKFISFDNISKIRLVCKHFNNMCSSILNSEFNRLRSVIQQRLMSIKSQMPRRESARRKHALAREHDIIETLNMRLSLLHMTLGKHIERKYCCFFPGEIIDEVYRVLRYITNTPCLNHGYKVTDELFDLSTMAMEYFKEHIEPRLPEISYFTPDFLDYSMLSSPHETQLALEETIARANSRSSSTSPKDPLILLSRHFRKIKEMVKKNGTDIVNTKHSLKLFKKKINSLEKEVQQIKWQQKDSEKVIPDVCKINEVLLEVNRHKLELEQLKAEVSNQSCSCHGSQSHTNAEKKDSNNSVLPVKEIHDVKLEMTDDKCTSSKEKRSQDGILLKEPTERKKIIKKEKRLSSSAQLQSDKKGLKGSSTQISSRLAKLKSLEDISEDSNSDDKICSEKAMLRTPSKRKNIRNKLLCSSPIKSNGKRKLNPDTEFDAENDLSTKKKKLDFNLKNSQTFLFTHK